MDTAPSATTTTDGDLTTITISGYLSASSDDVVASAVGQVGDAQRVLVAFARDSFANSVGIGILLEHILPLKDQGKHVRIVHPAAHFREVFDIVGLSKDVEVFADEEQAVTGW